MSSLQQDYETEYNIFCRNWKRANAPFGCSGPGYDIYIQEMDEAFKAVKEGYFKSFHTALKAIQNGTFELPLQVMSTDKRLTYILEHKKYRVIVKDNSSGTEMIVNYLGTCGCRNHGFQKDTFRRGPEEVENYILRCIQLAMQDL